jgi:fatty acid desaturase
MVYSFLQTEPQMGPFSRPPTGELSLARKTLKQLMRRSDGPPLARLGVCSASLALWGWLYFKTIGTWWMIPALIIFGAALSLTVYSLSHECSHGTPFRSRWLNETVFWIVSLLFGQEVLYRRYSHAAHHTYTMYVGQDAQLPFTQPVRLKDYLLWYSGILYHTQFLQVLLLHSVGKFSEKTRSFTPHEELPRMIRNSRIFLLIYGGAALLSWYFSSALLLWFWIFPKLVGDPVMLTYAASQHFEKEENTDDLRRSTRSLRSNWLIDLFYWNMSYHVEHHLYPTIPFFSLPVLNGLLKDRLPQPAGILSTTRYIFRACRMRTLQSQETG